ncbi:MAG TPA: hypothetical protein VM142_03645 [Acidimicrobiales bacterium]|nr:hypothetical protein [Acidimicrobiales bacterium]
MEVLTAVQAEADIVLVDCPPVLPVTDAAVLSSRVDATLLVATAGETTRKEMARTIELLSHVDAPILGTVLNGAGDEDSYGYSYRYSYSSTPAGSRSDKNKVKAKAKKERAAQAKV